MFVYIADFILITHFVVIIFITSLFIMIPIGYKFNWLFLKNKSLRTFHLGLMILVTLETIFGIACPLTYLENFFLQKVQDELFLTYWLSKVIYWDLPSSFFTISYLICLIWTIKMWQLFPPKKM